MSKTTSLRCPFDAHSSDSLDIGRRLAKRSYNGSPHPGYLVPASQWPGWVDGVSDKPEPPRGKRPPARQDAAGREFAGETGLAESDSGPRVTGPPAVRPAPRPPGPPRPPREGEAALRQPDSNVAGSQYFKAGISPDRAANRALPAFGRERDIDSDADELAVDEDLGALTRRKERERASQHAARQPAPPPAHETGGSATRKDLDAEAGARELDAGSPHMNRRRRRREP